MPYLVYKANAILVFQGLWYGVLHHVVDEHEWVLPYSSSSVSSCLHGPLVRDVCDVKEWLKKGSPPHQALRSIVLDKRLINQVHYYLNFRYFTMDIYLLFMFILVLKVVH